MGALGALEPTHMPRATAYIPQMVAMIEDLIAKDWEKNYPDDYYHRVYLEEHPVEPDDLLEIVFTSGTTGDPKGVMHTHDTRCRSSLGTISGTRLTSEDIWLIMVPLSHTTALVNAFYSSVISGSCGSLAALLRVSCARGR